MRVVPKIDWLTLTRPKAYGYDNPPTSKQSADLIALHIYEKSEVLSSTGVIEVIRKEPFYQYHYTNADGHQLSLSESQLQGVRLVLAGHTLPVGQADQRRLYEGLRNEYWRVSRCDIAVDFFDAGEDILGLWDEHIQEQAYKRRNKATLILSPSGDTINIGSRKSDKYIRIYDKGLEQKSDMDWKRFEIEIKYKTAHNLNRVYNVLIRRAVATMGAMIESLPQAYRGAFNAIADGWEGFARPAPKTRSNRELWIMEQVLPALKKLYFEDRALYDKFTSSLPSVDD